MLKNLAYIMVLTLLVTSCSTLKPSASQNTATVKQTSSTKDASGNSIQFISNIAIHPDAQQDKTGSSIATASDVNSGTTNFASDAATENLSALQFKYSILEISSVEDLDNAKLLTFMDYWYGAPYHTAALPGMGSTVPPLLFC